MVCLFCGSENIQEAGFPWPTFFNTKTFFYKECGNCHLVFIDPPPSPDDYAKMYAASYHNQFYFKETAPDFTSLDRLLENHITEKSIVDYGCGDGSFLKFFAGKGYQCTGVEYDPELVERLKKERPGIRFYTTNEFFALDPQTTFPAIYMGDVLEHMTAPASFLSDLLNKLAPKGLLLAQGPLENNANLALSFRKTVSGILSKKSAPKIASHVPYHIFFANAKNQKAFFEDRGLRTLVYDVYETAWPFPPKPALNPVHAVKFGLAQASIFFSKLLPGRMGNRFTYLGVKN